MRDGVDDIEDEEELLIKRAERVPSRPHTNCRRTFLLLLGAAMVSALLLLAALPHFLAGQGTKSAGGSRGRSMTEEDLEAAFWSTKVMRRQMAAFEAECACTRGLMAAQAREHHSLQRVLVIDGSLFRWEGLGNSGVRWMGLLRWGYSTGRATFLKLNNDCSGADQPEEHAPWSGRRSDRRCHLDLGEYVTGEGGVDWWWGGGRAEDVARRLSGEGAREEVLTYGCAKRRPPGCAQARLTFANGSHALVREPHGLRRFFSSLPSRWVRLELDRADAIELSYSRPESLRDVLPLTRCPVAGAADFRQREMALKCETFANMRPRPKLMRALLPHLRELEPFDVVIGVHLRTGFADWQYRNGAEYFKKLTRLSTTVDQSGWSLFEHWAKLDSCLQDCKSGTDRPCFNWETPRVGEAPRVSDALRCRTPGTAPDFVLTRHAAPPGPMAALLSCAGRLGQSLVATLTSALPLRRPKGKRRGRLQGLAGGGGEDEPLRWGLLVLSDAPAFPSLAAALPALAGRVVTTAGSGALGHSSFTQSCSVEGEGGCAYGRDPAGAWTRSVVDFYLAGCVDGFVKALFTSFIWSTMRRNLLCCRPGTFVQWMAWYNRSRTHRDLPMADLEFMRALSTTHRPV
ncbi:hypothetical protein AB1Y20_004825 [Prymnesium parvum]|uniref:Protein xylosyltransferase n=1 Tax=Prymnesium parvum TaxID=97485 RepID=A0AB34J1D1_PRYPA